MRRSRCPRTIGYNWSRYLCLPNGRPADGPYEHNPFTGRRPDLRGRPAPPGPNVNYSDFSDLDTLASLLDANLRDPRGRPLRLFPSEFFVPTHHVNNELPFSVRYRVQAEWLTAALRIARRWPRIYTLGWLSLYDDPSRPDRLDVHCGMIDLEGARKLAYYAYRRG